MSNPHDSFWTSYSDLVPPVQRAQHKEPLFNFVFDANKHLTTAIGAHTVPTEKEAELCT